MIPRQGTRSWFSSVVIGVGRPWLRIVQLKTTLMTLTTLLPVLSVIGCRLLDSVLTRLSSVDPTVVDDGGVGTLVAALRLIRSSERVPSTL